MLDLLLKLIQLLTFAYALCEKIVNNRRRLKNKRLKSKNPPSAKGGFKK